MASLILTDTDLYIPEIWDDYIHFLAMLKRDHAEQTSFDNFVEAIRLEPDAKLNIGLLSTELAEEISPYLPFFISPTLIRDRFIEFGESLYYEVKRIGLYQNGFLHYRFKQWFGMAMILTYDPIPMSRDQYTLSLQGR